MENIVTDDTIQREQISSAQPQAENIRVRYNHEDKVLSYSDAVAYAQKGMKYDSLEPLMKELNYLSQLKNKTPIETVREYIAEQTNSQLKNSENKEEEVFCDEDKIVEQFYELQKNCPEIDSFDKIPDEVLKNIPQMGLYTAYLKFFYDEQMKINKIESKKQANLIATAGALKEGGDNPDSLLKAFIKGLKE